jgi:hypothetical protein
MTFFARVSVFFLLITILGFVATPSTQADPLLFSNVVALQNNNTTRVDLFSNPGTILIGPQVSFFVDLTGTLPPSVTNTLRVTFTEAGRAPVTQTFDIPVFGTIPPPVTLLFTFTAFGATPQGTSGILTVDILGSSPDFIIPGGPDMGQRVDSYTYSFKVAEPVPEPSTLIIFGTGLFGLTRRLRARRREADKRLRAR